MNMGYKAAAETASAIEHRLAAADQRVAHLEANVRALRFALTQINELGFAGFGREEQAELSAAALRATEDTL